MNFFQAQEKAHKKTKLLVFLFLLALFFLILAIYLPIQWSIWWAKYQDQKILLREIAKFYRYDGGIFSAVAAGVTTVVLSASLFRISQLSGGGSSVATYLGGRPVDLHPHDFHENRLRNVVEEMSIASGVRVPDIYILDQEQSINAFAAGYSCDDAAIAVTRGALEKLSRDELQGVIAHEFSHILNGDMKLNIRLMGILYGIWFISIIGKWLARSSSYRSRSRNRDGGSVGLLAGIALFLIGLIGYFFGKVIQAAVSRQREYLADASAVQFTRNPKGIAEALKKIGGYTTVNPLGSSLHNQHAEEVSHMTFGPVSLLSDGGGFLSTHPPLEERISLLDPAFRPEDYHKEKTDWVSAYVHREQEILSGIEEKQHVISQFEKQMRVPEQVEKVSHVITDMVGTLTADQIHYSAHFLETLPHALYKACHHPQKAKSMVYVLLSEFDRDLGQRLTAVLATMDPESLPLYEECYESVFALGPNARMPLLDLCLPSLEKLTKSDYILFAKTLDALISADQKLSLFEAILLTIIKRHLRPRFFPRKSSGVRYRTFRPIQAELVDLISCLVVEGQDQDHQEQAFALAMKQLSPRGEFRFNPHANVAQRVYEVLSVLESCAPLLKQEILRSCCVAIFFNHQLNWKEGELLRAVADSMACPMPNVALLKEKSMPLRVN
ncbi:MAG: M48 family metallopeptidase [Bdellovibrionota bacterium]